MQVGFPGKIYEGQAWIVTPRYLAVKYLSSWCSEGGMIWLETLIELKFRAFRDYPLIEIRQTILYRAIRGNSISVNSTLPPS